MSSLNGLDTGIEALRALLLKRGFKLDHSSYWYSSPGKHCKLRLADGVPGSPFVTICFVRPGIIDGWEKWDSLRIGASSLSVLMADPNVVEVLVGWYEKYARASLWYLEEDDSRQVGVLK